MTTEQAEILRALFPTIVKLPPKEQAALTYMIAHPPATSAAICAHVDGSTAWFHGALVKLRAECEGVATIKHVTGPDGGYVVQVLTADEWAKTFTFTSVPVPADTEGERSVNVEQSKSYTNRPPVWFVFPWPGSVDLHKVSAVGTDKGQLVIQLARGGFLRGPQWPNTNEVAAAVVDALAKIDGARVVVYSD